MDRPSSHSQRVPYARKEGRKSLFSKMKDSMRDMLSPSWLTDLVHNVNKDSPTDDKNMAKGSEQSSVMQSGPSGVPDMVASQTPMMPPGPVGMMSSDVQQQGLNRDSPFKNRGTFVGNGQPRTLDFATVGQGINPSGTVASPFQQGNFPPPISEFTSAQLPLARITEKSDSIMAQEDTMSQRSDGSKSTSGCSSMIPQTDVGPQQNIVGDKRKAPEQVTLGGMSPQEHQAAKRQRLHAGNVSNQTFSRRLSDTFISRQSTPAMSHRPAFNTSLFGSPLNNESSLLGTSIHESSFYPGKTKFGGRSSLSFRSQKKNADLNQSLPSRLSVPVKAFMKARPKLNPNKEAVTSSTAKRILEALDKMPTPLNDAKKIPMVPRQWTESPSFFSRDTSRSVNRSGPPTQKLNISSQASISKNRQVSFAPVQQPRPSTSRVPEQTISRPTRQDTVILSSETMAPSGKMKRDKSYHRGSASVKTALEEEDTVIIPDLQTEFTLPVSSMPQFSFATPASQPKSVEPNKNSTVNRSPACTGSPAKHALNFTFSSPIIEPVPANKPASPQKYGGFQFSSPISVDKKNDTSTGPTNFNKPAVATTITTFGSGSTPAFSFSSPATKSNMDINFSTAPKPKPRINGPVEPADRGMQAASELKQGSVMDILGGGSSSKSFTSSSQSSTPLATGLGNSQVTAAPPPLSAVFKQSGWSCDVCLINNKDEASKCIACQTPKPGGLKSKDLSSTSDPAEPLKSDLFAKFKQPGGSWTCDTCLIQNKHDDIKCVACQTRKPGSASSNSSLLVSSIQPGNWICNICLIQNKKDDTICGACKAAKSTPKPSEINKSDSLFSKLKPAAGSWECEVCLVQNKSDDNSCVACHTPKPLKFFKHPPGDWTCDTCLVNNKASAVNCVACNYARPGPPRTQTVPSIAKSYTLSQASGFNIASTESGNISMSSTGGFKFTPAASAPASGSGFDVSKLNENANKSSDSKLTSGGGFKFNSDSKSETSSSGFKFGTQSTSESDKSSVSTGGFKIDTVPPSGDKPATGFQFGNSDKKSENKDAPLKSAGFQFGKSDSSLSSSSSNKTTVGGIVFGQKSDMSSTKEEVQATTSVPGGFTFKSSDSSVKTTETDLTKTLTTTTPSVGGFNFTSLTSTNSLASTSSSSIGTFAFTATKATDPSILSGTSKPIEATKPAMGGFSFGQKPAESNTSNSPFSFAQKPVSVASPNKRGRDDDTGQPEVKKSSYSFGQIATSNSSTPFQFGANTVATTTTTSSSSASFVFGQTPVTTSASTGLFAFGQQNSTPASTAGQPVFGLQNSTPASSAIPSVFGQQNATLTTTSSTSSNFVFGGTKAAPLSSTATALPVFGQTNSLAATTTASASTLPVFGQTNSLAATTTASASTPSLFQFGQANNTSASTPFNFASQSSGQAPVFGSSTPSFNFTAQKTEISTPASASGLFKFGGNPSQPVPATTPAFGSGSAFGSSSAPAFGTGSGSTGAFSGNAPSTTPAFGATPPAFGSSNSSTGQAAPAFGGNVLCMPVPVVSACLSAFLNVSVLSTCHSSSALPTCYKTSTRTSPVSVYSSVVKVSSSCYSQESSIYATAENSSGCITSTVSEDWQTCNEFTSSTSPLKSSSSSFTGKTSKNSSQQSFFHGCYDDWDDGFDRTLENSEASSKHKLDDCQVIVPKSANQKIIPQELECPEVTFDLPVRSSVLVDADCQTDDSVTLNLRTANTQTENIENRNLKTVSDIHCTPNSVCRGVQTEWSVIGKKEDSVSHRCNAQSVSNNDSGFQMERSGVYTSNTEIGSEATGRNNTSLRTTSQTVLGVPKTGVANEPLSCGKLFIVPCFIDCLDNATILSPAITKPLMISRLTPLPKTEMPGCHNLPLMSELVAAPPSTSVSSLFRFGATSLTNFQSHADKSMYSAISTPGLPATLLLSSNPSMNLPCSTSTVFVSLNLPVSATKFSMSLPANPRSLVYGNAGSPQSTVPVFESLNLPTSKVVSPIFKSVVQANVNSQTGKSPEVGTVSLPRHVIRTSVFGHMNLASTTANTLVFGRVNLLNTAVTSSGNANLASKFQIFGSVSLPSSTVFSPIFGNLSLPSSSVMSPIFGNLSLPSSSVTTPVFGSVILPSSTVFSPVIGNLSLPSSSVMSPIFGSVSLPSSTVFSPVFGNLSLPSSSIMSPIFGSVSLPSSTVFSPVFGNLSLPNSSVMSPMFGSRSLTSRAALSPIFGNVSVPNSSVSSQLCDRGRLQISTTMSIFGSANLTSSAVTFPLNGSPSLPHSLVGSSIITTKGNGNTIDNKTGFILNMPFKSNIFQQSTKESDNRTNRIAVSQNVNPCTNSVFVFGRPAVSVQNSVSATSKPNVFQEITRESNIRTNEIAVSRNVNTSTNSLFVFGRPAVTTEQLVCPTTFSTASFFSRPSIFTCRNNPARFSDNVAVKHYPTDDNCRSGNFGHTGVFSFQGPAVLDDVVMEDGSPESVVGSPERLEQIQSEPETLRKVAFSFCPPATTTAKLGLKDPSSVNKAGKSILKAKNVTFACKENQEQSESNSGTIDFTKIPSDSCILGGNAVSGDTQRLVCNSKSMPFTSDFMMKEEQGEGNMDTSASTKCEQKSTGFNVKTSQTSFNFHSPQPSFNIHSYIFSSGNEENSFNPSNGSDISTGKDWKLPLPFKETLQFGSVPSGSSFPSGIQGRKSPPPPHLLKSIEALEICTNSTASSFIRPSEPVSSISEFVRNFPPISPNVFVFSSNQAPSVKSVQNSSVRSKKKNLKSKSKQSKVSAFSGKPIDQGSTEREPSPSSSRFSKSSESAHSGSDVSRNSSSTHSSHSGHRVSSSSSSSSDSSNDTDDDHTESGSQPMEDDVRNNGDRNNIHMGFSGRGNKSWNACPLEEKNMYSQADDLSHLVHQNRMFKYLYYVSTKTLLPALSCNRLAESYSWCEVEESSHECVLCVPSLLSFSGVFGNSSQPAAPAQSNSVFQFGAKPVESTPAAPSAGFNFSASANPAGLGTGGSFNFTAQAPAVNAFSATATGSSTPADGRKIKKAVRKIRR